MLSLVAVIILSPVFLIISILVRVKMGSPILYSQERIGKHKKIFKMRKFRSMTNECDENGNLLPNEKRLTKFGKFIRSTSIDELPELFSIIKGDMSIIGPRPLRACDLPYFREEEAVIHSVRGGLIPPDVLSGQPIITYEEQFKYEMDYANNVSFRLDVKILIVSISILFKRANEDYGAAERPHLKDYRSNKGG